VSKIVNIMRGIPGSGKSRKAGELAEIAPSRILTTDDFFTKKGPHFDTDDYEENFDYKMLPEAHGWNLNRYAMQVIMDEEVDCLIVDNTNISIAEIAPYYQLATAFGWEARIYTVVCGWKVAADRNTHGVTVETVRRMALSLDAEERNFPPWWDHSVVIN